MIRLEECESQSTIKMEKGYYGIGDGVLVIGDWGLGSQSTIKMEKGYYHSLPYLP